MVELSTGAATAVAAGGGAALLLLAGLLAASVRHWRGAARRLGAVASRLEVPGVSPADDRDVVGRVERLAQAARRDFLANLTAELKAPLGALGLLAGTVVAEDDPALTRRLAALLEADALRVGRLVDDLAELSRLESQALPAREPVSAHLLVAQAVERAAAAAPGRSVAVDVSGVGPDEAVVGDRRQLVAALAHLVENAVLAGTGVCVAVAAAGGRVDVAVSDDGPGIPAGELERGFEAFYRTGAARERSPAGSGLGLAIAARVAAAAGGEVLVASEVGRGSTFTLRLPAAERARASGREAG